LHNTNFVPERAADLQNFAIRNTIAARLINIVLVAEENPL